MCQRITRHLQSGAASEDIEQDLVNDLDEHRKVARYSLHDMKLKCEKQCKYMAKLESATSSPERNERLKMLQSTFTLPVSVDCQSKFIRGAQPSLALPITFRKCLMTFMELCIIEMKVATCTF